MLHPPVAAQEESLPVQLRNTRQRDAIRAAFVNADRPLSPEETLSYAQKHVQGISIATVYRNISTLVEENWLTAISVPGEPARYEVAGKEHHHHFRCTSCNKVFEMPGCAIQTQPNLPKGFKVTGHEFFLFGFCSSCR